MSHLLRLIQHQAYSLPNGSGLWRYRPTPLQYRKRIMMKNYVKAVVFATLLSVGQVGADDKSAQYSGFLSDYSKLHLQRTGKVF